MRTHRRWIAVASFLAAGLGGCTSHASPADEQDGSGPVYVLSFKDINTKLAPGALDDDGDGKDVAIKSRASFKPSKGGPTDLSKRMKLKSKDDSGEASVGTEVQMTGDVTARLRVAVDSLTALVDDVSLGFLERRAAEGGPVKRLEAVWNADIDGFTVRALEDGTPTGSTLDLPGAREAVLFISDNGPNLVLEAGEPTGDSLLELDPFATLASLTQEASTETALFAFGAQGLGVKAVMWFAQFTLEFGDDILIGDEETAIATSLGIAQHYLDIARTVVDSGASGAGVVANVYNYLSTASSNLSNAWNLLIAANLSGTLQPTTQGPAAEKNTMGALGWVFPASQDIYEIMLDGGTSVQPVKSHIKVGIKKTELAIAQVVGFKSNSHGKLESILDFSSH